MQESASVVSTAYHNRMENLRSEHNEKSFEALAEGIGDAKKEWFHHFFVLACDGVYGDDLKYVIPLGRRLADTVDIDKILPIEALNLCAEVTPAIKIMASACEDHYRMLDMEAETLVHVAQWMYVVLQTGKGLPLENKHLQQRCFQA